MRRVEAVPGLGYGRAHVECRRDRAHRNAFGVHSMTRVVIVIPALNEAGAIERVVTAALNHADDVIVVDDGSTDGTGDLAQHAGAFVVRHERNLGVGTAVANGLAAARERGATVAVQLDGDGQHDATCVPALLEEIDGGANLVIGTRFESGFPMSVVRRTVTKLFAWAVSRRVGRPISDPTSGFRAFDERAMDMLIPIFPKPYLSDTVELLLIAAEHDLIVRAVPVRMFERSSGQASAGLIQSVGFAMRVVLIIARHSRLGARSR